MCNVPSDFPADFTFSKEIEESHPARLDTDIAYKADTLAMQLVGERVSKRDLVNLVRWLILDKAEKAIKAL